MSYDLYFQSSKALSLDEVRSYFAGQPLFTVSAKRAHSENEATGVYFGFDFTDAPSEGRLPVAFHMNYYRPHVFGLEAEPVLTAFVEHFQLTVDDRQSRGKAAYSPAEFLDAWNYGNRCGYHAILRSEPAGPPTLPAAKIEAIWRWNRMKDRAVEHLVDRAGEVPPCFVPTVMLFKTAAPVVQTVIVWDGAMPIAIPEVDLVVTMVDKSTAIVAARPDVLRLVEIHSEWEAPYEVGDGLPVGLRACLIDEVSPATTKTIRAAMVPFAPLARLSPDRILDAELVAEERTKPT